MPEIIQTGQRYVWIKLVADVRRVSSSQIVWQAGQVLSAYQGADPNGDPCWIATDGVEVRYLDLKAAERI